MYYIPLLKKSQIKMTKRYIMLKDTLKILRLEKGETQKELAQKLNVPQSNYNRWETGERKPNSENLEKLAVYFGVTVDYLLGRELPFYNYRRLFDTVGENVKSERLKKGLTQKQLAKLVGVKPHVIEAIEEGREIIDIDAIEVLALALEIPLDYLVEENSELKKIIQGGRVLEKADENFRFLSSIYQVDIIRLLYKKVRFEDESDTLTDEELNIIFGGENTLSTSEKINYITLRNLKELEEGLQSIETKIREERGKYDELFGYYYRGESYVHKLVDLFTEKD